MSSRAFIREMGRWLKDHAKKPRSLVETCFDMDVRRFSARRSPTPPQVSVS
jgi:deoxyhypusine synthase